MSITNELREYAGSFYLFRYKDVREKLDAIADRIDGEYQKAMRELNNLADASVLLPVDADGVPIHIGDKVTEHEDGHTFKVDGFMDWDGRWWVFMRDGIQAPASRCTHYHAPTVEDVMVEFATDWECAQDLEDKAAVLKEYAVKLRLADDGKEQQPR